MNIKRSRNKFLKRIDNTLSKHLNLGKQQTPYKSFF